MSTPDEHVRSWAEGELRHVRLERTARRNAITLPMFASLAAILRRADADVGARIDAEIELINQLLAAGTAGTHTGDPA